MSGSSGDGFRVGLTRDLLNSRGEPSFGTAALSILDESPVPLTWEYLPETVPEITPDIAARYDALYVNSLRVTAESVGRADRRVRIIARHGVGYDSVDIPAATRAGVVVTNTPDGVRRPVATMAITFVLALAQKLFTKDRLTRAGRWLERTDHMGTGLTGRTVGIIGAGSIGRETMRFVRAFDMRILAADPYADADALAPLGAALVDIDTLLAEADFVIVACLLTEETRHLLNAERLRRMRPDAYLINVARGPIVDEAALIDALRAGRIAGAALDVFEQEPVDPGNPLLAMENVIVTPHSLCWTDECFGNIARSGLTAIVDALAGRRPQYVVNTDVLDDPRVRAWLRGGA